MKPDLVSGSSLWQTVFVSFALILVLFQIARGWRLGLPRQLVRIVAVVAAYASALFGGKVILPFLRPLVKVPDFVISATGGVLLAMIVYSLINTVGVILFKRTGQQESSVLRLVYGFSGAILGLFFGLFFIWLMIVGIRSVGAVAEAAINARAPGHLPFFHERRARPTNPEDRVLSRIPDEDSLAVSLTRLKQSLEFGPFGNLVKQTAVLPSGIYETLGKVGEVFAEPERAMRFASYPGVTELADHPKILALRADPEIADMIQKGRFFDLLQDDRLIEAANDPDLAERMKKFDFKAALDYAVQN